MYDYNILTKFCLFCFSQFRNTEFLHKEQAQTPLDHVLGISCRTEIRGISLDGEDYNDESSSNIVDTNEGTCMPAFPANASMVTMFLAAPSCNMASNKLKVNIMGKNLKCMDSYMLVAARNTSDEKMCTYRECRHYDITYQRCDIMTCHFRCDITPGLPEVIIQVYNIFHKYWQICEIIFEEI